MILVAGGKDLGYPDLGCGYTGQSVAKRFLVRGARVTATTRSPHLVCEDAGNFEFKWR